jgi:uncharacterized protein YndB with AHSA1/START domain
VATNRRTVSSSASAVWAAIADGYSYSHWVVGTRVVRDVDAEFPAAGRLHYTLGRWPLKHESHTEVISADPGRCLELRINALPAATVRVVISLAPRASGCLITMTEHPDSGLVARLHNPLFDALVWLRNAESLRRLAQLARRYE